MATYVGQVLQPEETVRFEGTLHWVIYLPGFVLAIFGIAGFIAMTGMAPRGRTVLSVFVYLALAIGALHLLVAWIKQVTTEIAVTNRRVIYKTGLISRRTVEMNMDKVESVDVSQNVFGRVLDYGTILIRGTGAGLEPLSEIASPLALRNAIAAR
jgi:uncharacterized membrane protein YdbT with pleckstrin-like domain